MKKRKRSLYRVFLQLLLSVFLWECLALSGCSGREAEILIQDFQTETKTAQADAQETADSKGDAEESSDTGKRKNSGDTAENSTDTKESEFRNTETQMQSETGNQIPDEELDKEQQTAVIYVDVCGAVVNPGVFALEEGSRVFQAVEAAGGYLPQAAQACVNRAQVLTDGQQIYIFTQEEMEQQGIRPGEVQNASVPADSATDSADRQDGKININTADESQLTALTGIGSTRAQAIIAYRDSHGPFLNIEDIMNVQGIKEGTFAKIKDEIVVE